MKGARFGLTIALLLLVSFISLYYILINSVFSDTILPNIKVEDYNVSFRSKSELDNFITEKYINTLPENLNVTIDDYNYVVPIKDLNVKVTSEDALDYGKGANVVKVLFEGVSLVNGKEIQLEYDIDPSAIISNFPIKINSFDPVSIEGENIVGCEKNEFYIDINFQKLEGIVINSLKNNTPVLTSFNEIATKPEQVNLIYYCSNFNQGFEYLNKFLYELNFDNYEDIFEFYIQPDNSTGWRIKNLNNLKQVLIDYQGKSETAPDEGEYVLKNNRIYLIEPFRYGRKLDVDATLTTIQNWIDKPDHEIELVYNTIQPDIANSQYEIVDYTYLLSEGKTRMDIIRDGEPNQFLPNARAGIEELENVIIKPGEEFSYIKTIKPYYNGYEWRTAQGRLIGGGYCNSTTTLFRAALEAGFQITKRSSHSYQVTSYTWGYPYNIVDAAYYSDPQIDLRFINDLNYPVIIKTEFTTPGDGWQYHTIKFYTSPDVEKRDVELTNWRIWNKKSEVQFTGAFDQVVSKDGVVIRSATFQSTYNPYIPIVY